MFLHGGMTHLLMNMFSLYLIGRGAEMYFDTKSYLSIYLFSGLLGGLASLYMHPMSVGVGASGAIFGVFGALAGFFLAHREKIASHTKAFMKDFAIIIGINLVIGFAIPSVDVSAHVGGLIIGFIGGFILSKNPRWIWIYSIAMILLMFMMMSYLPGQYVQALF
jgi:rhomboid protease GluP